MILDEIDVLTREGKRARARWQRVKKEAQEQVERFDEADHGFMRLGYDVQLRNGTQDRLFVFIEKSATATGLPSLVDDYEVGRSFDDLISDYDSGDPVVRARVVIAMVIEGEGRYRKICRILPTVLARFKKNQSEHIRR